MFVCQKKKNYTLEPLKMLTNILHVLLFSINNKNFKIFKLILRYFHYEYIIHTFLYEKLPYLQANNNNL